MSEILALLQTDIVDSTALSERLGDAAMAALWAEHDRVARDLLPAWRGREIDKSDGFLLTFATAADAVGYAIAYHRALTTLPSPLSARAGLHVGPVEMRENPAADVSRGAKHVEIDGLAKPITARIMSLARGGQTLMTGEALRNLGSTPLRTQSHGHWRLKGIEDPFELFEVGSADAPFLPPPDTDKVYRVLQHQSLWVPLREMRHTLPAERDSFVGREAVLQELAQQFEGGARLVSLLGIGGTGKTRVAQRFGWTWLGDFPGGVWFCDLSQARGLDGIAHAVAGGLDIPLGRAEPIAQIAGALAGRGRCLVILDNFEQVASHAEATLGRWLDRARDARFIVTTRELLGVAGERSMWLAPLSPSEGMDLFLRRAQAARQDFRLADADRGPVQALVQLLDGLPLAIELAAARVRVLPPRMLQQRMSERFKLLGTSGERRERQSTLRATFDWSWDLLSLAEKAALAQLSVFEGGIALVAAEQVLDFSAVETTPWPIDVLQSLVEKSLVRHGDHDRFELLTTVQEYAAEHLRTERRYAGSGPQARRSAEARHYAYFSAIGKSEAVAHSCIELDNLVVACRRAAAHGEIEPAVGALERAWEALVLRGPFRVGIQLAETVEAIAGNDRGAVARIACVAGMALQTSGKVADAAARLQHALAAARAVDDRRCEGRVLRAMGDSHVNEGRMDEGRAELDRALALAREAGDLLLECETLVGLGNLHEHLGNMSDAKAHYEGALATARRAEDRRWEGGSLGNLGLLYANQGKMAQARSHYEQALAVARELGDRQWEGNTLCNLGLLHHVQGREAEAKKALVSALAVAREMGHARLECIVLCNLGMVYEALSSPSEAREHYDAAVAVARSLGDRRSEGQFLNYLGLLHARERRFDESRSCLDTAERLLTEVADRLNLGVLMCSRAEAEFLAGSKQSAGSALQRAVALAAEVQAEPESELVQALERVRNVLGSSVSPLTSEPS